MGTRSNHHERGRSANEQPIRGAAHLVNPPEDSPDAAPGSEDEVERDYLGRILHVADRALRQAKEVFHRTRRGSVH